MVLSPSCAAAWPAASTAAQTIQASFMSSFPTRQSVPSLRNQLCRQAPAFVEACPAKHQRQEMDGRPYDLPLGSYLAFSPVFARLHDQSCLRHFVLGSG